MTVVDVAIARAALGLVPEYLAAAINSPLVAAQVRAFGKGSTRFRVPTGGLKQVLVPVPPVQEQRRIVARVDELMAWIDQFEAARIQREAARIAARDACLATLCAATNPTEVAAAWSTLSVRFDSLVVGRSDVLSLRRSIRSLAVCGRLAEQSPRDESATDLLKRISATKAEATSGALSASATAAGLDEPHLLPAGWAWASFSRVADVASNLVDPSDFGDLPHIAPDNIEKETGRLLEYCTVREDDIRSSNHRFFPGQILYSKIRPNLSKVVAVDFEGLCSADMYPINARIERRYLMLFMLSTVFLRQVTSEDNRVAMPKVNQEQLARVMVAVPPLSEQLRIVSRAEDLLALCDQLDAALANAQTASESVALALAATEVLA